MSKVKNSVGPRWAKFCGWLLRRMGWRTVSGPATEPKVILLGAPHTSVLDFLICYLSYAQFGRLAHIMIKKEFFFWPLGSILRACGAVPVDRKSATSAVMSLIKIMNEEEVFHFGISPEGTRKATMHWKTGYRLIAQKTGAVVYGTFFDWRTKQVGKGEKIEVTDDEKTDLRNLYEYYKSLNLHGFHEDGYNLGES